MVRLKLSTNGECIGKFRYLYVRPELLSKGSEAFSHSLSLRSIAFPSTYKKAYAFAHRSSRASHVNLLNSLQAECFRGFSLGFT